MTLYEIKENLQQVLDGAVDEETGELLIDFEELEKATNDFNEKVEACGCYYKGLLAEIKAYKEEEDRLAKRRKALSNKADNLLNYIKFCLDGEKFSCPQFDVKYGKSKETVIDRDKFLLWALDGHEDLLKISYEPSKTAIKNAIANGENVPFAEIVEKTNMSIK